MLSASTIGMVSCWNVCSGWWWRGLLSDVLAYMLFKACCNLNFNEALPDLGDVFSYSYI